MDKTKAVDLMLCPRLVTMSVVFSSQKKVLYDLILYLRLLLLLLLSHFSRVRLCDPIDGSPPGSPPLGFSRQKHWSGLPFPSPVHESEK